MNILEMIKEWERGCSDSNGEPSSCQQCTDALIVAIKNKLTNQSEPLNPAGGEGPNGGTSASCYHGCEGGQGDEGGKLIDHRLAVVIPEGTTELVDFVISSLSNNGYFCEDKDVNFTATDHKYGTSIVAHVDYYVVLPKKGWD